MSVYAFKGCLIECYCLFIVYCFSCTVNGCFSCVKECTVVRTMKTKKHIYTQMENQINFYRALAFTISSFVHSTMKLNQSKWTDDLRGTCHVLGIECRFFFIFFSTSTKLFVLSFYSLAVWKTNIPYECIRIECVCVLHISPKREEMEMEVKMIETHIVTKQAILESLPFFVLS